MVPLTSFSLDFSAKSLKGFYFICFFESHVTHWSLSPLFHAYYALFVVIVVIVFFLFFSFFFFFFG